MMEPSRTTEPIHRAEEAIRGLMAEIRDLPVPDRASLALGLVGDLAAMMDRDQMAGLLDELWEEAGRVQDAPPSRQRETASAGAGDHGTSRDVVSGSDRTRTDAGEPLTGGATGRQDDRAEDRRGAAGVGQEGRGEFRAGRLL
jgi:hypothetical protein